MKVELILFFALVEMLMLLLFNFVSNQVFFPICF